MARRRTADKRRLLEPLRERAQLAEATVARLSREREALERRLGACDSARITGPAISEALKRRAELIRLIAEAESEWFLNAEALERAEHEQASE